MTDPRNNRIQKFNSSGGHITQISNSSYYEGVAIDTLGNVYIADYLNHRIQKFDSSGSFLLQFGSLGIGDGQFNYPIDLDIDSSGNVYVADTYNDRIQKFDSSGNFLLKFGVDGNGDGQLKHPSGIAISDSGDIYVADTFNNRIQKFDQTGNFLLKFGTYGSGEEDFILPGNIEILPNGNLIIVDEGNNRVVIWGIPELQFSSVTPSTTGTTTTISFTTSDIGSTQVEYGTTVSLGNTTVETDTGTRVTSHSVSFTTASCSTLYYRLRSVDENFATSTSATYSTQTGGCTGSASVIATSTTEASPSSTSTITISSLTLTIPPNYSTTTNATTTFQALQLSTTTFALSALSPTGMTSIGSDVIHLTSLIDATTTLTSFTTPLSLTFTYNPASLNGVSESSLTIYRYDGSTWYPLSDCVVDTNAHTVTCTTTNFSDFTVFGTIPQAVAGPVTSGGSYFVSSGPMLLPVTTSPATTTILATTATSTFTPSSTEILTQQLPTEGNLSTPSTDYPRILKRGSVGEDVKSLQIFLNNHHFGLASSGYGSPNNETTYFGNATEKALILFQEFYAKQILAPLGLTKGTGVFGEESRAEVMRR